jgi:uncharacterized repeat protein (TIGR01451 family)
VGRKRVAAAALGVALVGGLTTACEQIPASGWEVVLATANAGGTGAGDGDAPQVPAISRDGTKVAMVTYATNLGPTDTNESPDVYIRDLVTGATTLATPNAAGTDAGNSGSTGPAFSPDGTKIAFVSSATDLGPADTDRESDVYVRDLASGAVTRIKPAPDACGPAHSGGPVFSPDGSKIAFVRGHWNDNGSDVYVHDLASGTTELASAHTGTSGCDQVSGGRLDFTPDGSRLVFESAAGDLGPTDTNGVEDVYIRDLQAGITSLVSVDAAGTDAGDGSSSDPDVSPDGTLVTFVSRASDLGPTDTNQGDDVYIRDLTTGTTSLVSVNAAGTDSGRGLSANRPTFSPDGTKVGFGSFATDLGPPDSNGWPDTYVRDLTSQTTTMASVDAAGTNGSNGLSVFYGFAGSSDRVVFVTTGTNLGPTDGDTRNDIYVRDLAAGTTALLSANAAGTASANGASDFPVPSPGASVVAFLSTASDLGPPDANGLRDVYVARYHDRADLSTTLDADPETVHTGDRLTYHATVTNGGPERAEAARVALVLPDGVTYVGATATAGTCSPPSGGQPAAVPCTFGTLEPGDTVDVMVDVTVTAPTGSTLEATAVAGTATFDPDSDANTASVSVEVN